MNAETTATNLLLTGRPGIGKTTAVQRLVELEPQLRLVGFLTVEVREQGQRVGFAAVTLAGERLVIAHRDLESAHRVGRYGVDADAIDRAVELSLGSTATADGFVVDEIGKMELFSVRFVTAMRRILDDSRPLVATIARRGGGFIAETPRRHDVETWQVNATNRDRVPRRAAEWLRERLAR